MTGSEPEQQIRPIVGADRPELEVFTCRGFREPWTDTIEEMIQDFLPNAIERDVVSTLGIWLDGRLSAVAVWQFGSEAPRLCHVNVVAVRIGVRRRGLALDLKKAVLQIAIEGGAIAAVSTVHWDNGSMINLNKKLGANVEQIDGDDEYCRCVIPLPSQ